MAATAATHSIGSPPHGWSAIAAPLAVLLVAAGVRVVDPPFLEDARLRVFDAFERAAPREPADVPVRVVDIDDASLTKVGQWPWPRTRIAELVRALARQGAGPIAFDVLFAEPDRTSPSNIFTLWPDRPELAPVRELAARLPDHDALLAQAFLDAPVVAGFALTRTPTPNARPPRQIAGFAQAGDDPRQFVAALDGAVVDLPELEQAARGNGHMTILAERDGITRRVPLVLRHGDALYPSLVAEALRVAQGASSYVVKSSGGSGERGAGSHTGIVSVKIGRLVVPTDAMGRVWLYPTADMSDHIVPAWRVLDGSLPPDALAGCIVFVGSSATGLRDIRATAVDPAASGVTIHAQLAEQILTGTFLQRPDWADGAELIYLVLLGGLLIVLLPRAGAVACAAIGIGGVALACGLSWHAFRRAHWLLDPVMPSLASLAIYLVGSFVNFRAVEAQRRRVRDAFGRYLSPVLVERLARQPGRLELGGESKPMTILFADIRGFTRIAERLDAQGLTRFMNRFFTPMSEVILDRQGTIDKYIGDCIMAFWNAPLDDAQHARHACEAALALRERLRRWNDDRAAGDEPDASTTVAVGVGINTGTCSVGNFGSDQRFDYSVLGDAVNLASRLQELTKFYGVDIIVGESTAEVSGMALLELDVIVVRGRTQPIRIFALLTAEETAPIAALREYHRQMLAAYRSRQWDRAEDCLRQCEAAKPRDVSVESVYRLYRERIAACRQSPPDADWQGVFMPVV